MELQTANGVKIVGSKVTTTTMCEYLKDSYWRVEQELVEERRLENTDEWESKSLRMSAEAEELETALRNLVLSVETYLYPRNNSLFNEPQALQVPDKTEDGEYVN